MMFWVNESPKGFLPAVEMTGEAAFLPVMI
jgi:hypothetical protein